MFLILVLIFLLGYMYYHHVKFLNQLDSMIIVESGYDIV
jgi:hypothetical protein